MEKRYKNFERILEKVLSLRAEIEKEIEFKTLTGLMYKKYLFPKTYTENDKKRFEELIEGKNMYGV